VPGQIADEELVAPVWEVPLRHGNGMTVLFHVRPLPAFGMLAPGPRVLELDTRGWAPE
jgi:hypothetical protein